MLTFVTEEYFVPGKREPDLHSVWLSRPPSLSGQVDEFLILDRFYVIRFQFGSLFSISLKSLSPNEKVPRWHLDSKLFEPPNPST